jgi:hypothetical protein
LSFFSRSHDTDLQPRRRRLILIHLIPARIRLGLFPSPLLFTQYPRIRKLYGKFIESIRVGDVAAYDRALERLQSGENRTADGGGVADEPGALDDVDVGMGVDIGIWMALERGREVCLRGLLRGVWVALDKTTRISISSFRTALRLQGLEMEDDEVECLVAGMIWKVRPSQLGEDLKMPRRSSLIDLRSFNPSAGLHERIHLA